MITKDRNPLIRLYNDVINQNKDVYSEIYNQDYINHAASFGFSNNLEGLTQYFSEFHKAFPDQHIKADDLIIVGDKIIARWTLTATHKESFLCFPPTNKKIVMTGIDIERIVDGKISEHWGAEDMLGLLEEIGAVPKIKEKQAINKGRTNNGKNY